MSLDGTGAVKICHPNRLNYQYLDAFDADPLHIRPVTSVDGDATPDWWWRQQPLSKGSNMPETVVHLSASARLVAGVLAEAREVTVIELTALAAVSKSTVAKTLAVLERAEAACRTVREADGIREADLWSPGPGLGELLSSSGADSGCGEAQPVRRSDDSTVASLGLDDLAAELSEQPGSEALVGTDDGGLSAEAAEAEAGDARSALPEGVQTAVVDSGADPRPAYADETASGGCQAAAPRERLASGGLAELVAAALAAYPDIEYTPTSLSRLLGGRSAGAIHNALEKMHSAGTAVRVCDKPKRYRHAGA